MKRGRELLALSQERESAMQCAIQEVPREMFHEILGHLDMYSTWVVSIVSVYCRTAVLAHAGPKKNAYVKHASRDTNDILVSYELRGLPICWPVYAACEYYGPSEVLFAARACNVDIGKAHAAMAAINANMPVLETLYPYIRPYTRDLVSVLARTGNIDAVKWAISHPDCPYDSDLPLAAFATPLRHASDVLVLLEYLTSLPDTDSISRRWAAHASQNTVLCDVEMKALFVALVRRYGEHTVNDVHVKNLIRGNRIETCEFVTTTCAEYLTFPSSSFLYSACKYDNVEPMEWLLSRGCIPNVCTLSVAAEAPQGKTLRFLHQAFPEISLALAYYTAVESGNTTGMQHLHALGFRVRNEPSLWDALKKTYELCGSQIAAVHALLAEHGISAVLLGNNMKSSLQ